MIDRSSIKLFEAAIKTGVKTSVAIVNNKLPVADEDEKEEEREEKDRELEAGWNEARDFLSELVEWQARMLC